MSDILQVPLYRENSFVNDYAIATGKFMLPVAQNPPSGPNAVGAATYKPVVVVQAFAPFRVRNTTYKANKSVNPPQLPAPVDSGPYTFLGGSVCIPLPTKANDNTFTWSVLSNFTYIENVYSDVNTGYVLGQPPWPWESQVADQGLSAQNAPPVINQSGIGPRVGYTLGQLVDFANKNYVYREPSYFPATFHSTSITSGPSSYFPL